MTTYTEKWVHTLPLEALASQVATWADVRELETQLACTESYIEGHTLTDCPSCRALDVNPEMVQYAANLSYIIALYRQEKKHRWTTAFLQKELQSAEMFVRSETTFLASNPLEEDSPLPREEVIFCRTRAEQRLTKYQAKRAEILAILECRGVLAAPH